MSQAHDSAKLLHGYLQRWNRRALIWDRRDVEALESALLGREEPSEALESKLVATSAHILPLRSQIAMLHLTRPSHRFPEAERFAEHLHYCERCHSLLDRPSSARVLREARRAIGACDTEVPKSDRISAEYRRRAEAIAHLRRLRFIPRIRSGELYLPELQLRQLDDLVLSQANHIGPPNLIEFFNTYVAESGIAFGDGTILRTGQFMPGLIHEGPDMAPLGLIYRVLCRSHCETAPMTRKPGGHYDVHDFLDAVTAYARILAPQYSSQHAMTPASPEHVTEVLERARMLDVVYGVHQQHPTSLWPLLDYVYGQDVPAALLAAAQQVTAKLLDQANRGDWTFGIEPFHRRLPDDERSIFETLLRRAEQWNANDPHQFPPFLVADGNATLPPAPILCATLFSHIVSVIGPDSVPSDVLGHRLEEFVDTTLRNIGAKTIRGDWENEEEHGDIDAGFVTDTAVVIFECKKSCQSFWGRVGGGASTVDHFVAILGKGVLQGLRLRRALTRGGVTVINGDARTELQLGDREYVHFVLTGNDDGCLHANVFFRSILIGLYNTQVGFTSDEGTTSPSRWKTKEKRANEVLSKLTAAVTDTLSDYGHEIDRLFRNLCTMPLGQLTFAATSLPTLDALERCLRAKIAVQNAQAGPHQDFYDAYRYANGESPDSKLIDFMVENGKLWLK